MSRPGAVVGALCALAVVALVAVALAQRNSLAFTLGVPRGGPAIALAPGDQACQSPIPVPPGGEFDRVGVSLGTYFHAGPRVGVEVLDTASHRPLAAGVLPPGYPDIGRVPVHFVKVGSVPSGRRIDVCVKNRGNRKVAVFGSPDLASRTSTARKNGQPTGADMTLEFARPSRSVLSLAPVAARRAALFKFSWVGAWVFWALAFLIVVGVPCLLIRAVASVE